MSSPILMLTGPTAVGKTQCSLDLAERLNAEIISADSRQVYRGLDIGTAKPSPEELSQVPHHFINERALGEPFSAGIFAQEANERIADILARGKTPLIVGGSTLYLHALKFGLAAIPPIPPNIRQRLNRRLEMEGSQGLFGELQRSDPEYAATLDPTKTQRIVRGLEVYIGTGRPLSSFFKDQPPPPFTYKTIVLNRPREELYARINRRVDTMLANGLLQETRALLDQGCEPTLNPLRTIGYHESIAHILGHINHEEMTRLMKRNSRRYAKRQITWFKRFDDFLWINAEPDFDVFNLQ